MRTADDYWNAATANKDKLRKLVSDWHPLRRTEASRTGPITARATERACQGIRKEIEQQSKPGRRVLDEFDKALAERDGKTFLVLLNETWIGIPESQDSRSLPGFFVLCDLCSECHLIIPDGEFDD